MTHIMTQHLISEHNIIKPPAPLPFYEPVAQPGQRESLLRSWGINVYAAVAWRELSEARESFRSGVQKQL